MYMVDSGGTLASVYNLVLSWPMNVIAITCLTTTAVQIAATTTTITTTTTATTTTTTTTSITTIRCDELRTLFLTAFGSSAFTADDNGQLRRRGIDANQDLNTVKYIKLYSSFLFPYLT